MLLLELIWGVIIFFILIVFSLGSYCFFFRSATNQQLRGSKSARALSLSNCFACGIFLSTCFLGLIPHVRQHENRLREIWTKTSGGDVSELFLKSELMVLIGFLVILLIEQLVLLCRPANALVHCHGRSTAGPSRESAANGKDAMKDASEGPASTTLLSMEGDDEPLVLNRFDSDDSCEEDGQNAPKIEFRRVVDEHSGPQDHSGHSHVVSCASTGISLNSCLLLLGLSTHSIFEGIALGMQNVARDFYSLLIAIMLHEVLCSFAFGVNLAQQRTRAGAAFLTAGFLAACIPLGMCSSIMVNSLESTDALLCRFVLEGLAAGTFIYVACVEMLSTELNSHGDTPSRGIAKGIAVIAGVVVFFLITVMFGRHPHDIVAAASESSPTLESYIKRAHL